MELDNSYNQWIIISLLNDTFMNPFISFLLGGWLLGEKETTVVNNTIIKEIKVGKCKACPEIGEYREDLGFCADDWCYKQYLIHLK